jgi:hypothetical protein
MACAVSFDQNVPDFVTNPIAHDVFKQLTGSSVDDLARLPEPDGQQVLGSLFGALTGGATKAAELAALSAQNADPARVLASIEDSSGSYSASGAGRSQSLDSGSLSDSGMGDMSAMINAMMGQLNPQAAPADKSQQGLREVIFANRNRGPAAVVEDRTLSLFDRVTYRYYYVGKRMVAQ